jgi:hypothetical protein
VVGVKGCSGCAGLEEEVHQMDTALAFWQWEEMRRGKLGLAYVLEDILVEKVR